MGNVNLFVENANHAPGAGAEKPGGELLARLGDGGFWEGCLSSSALATALAAFALDRADAQAHATPVGSAAAWLLEKQNRDGGWGDSPASPSNRTASLICRSVLNALAASQPPTGDDKTLSDSLAQAENWLAQHALSLAPEALREGVLRDYGDDKTFSVPILTLLALTGDVPWEAVPHLPFELGVLPQRVFRWLRLPVVSYALPALISMGLARHRRRPTAFPPWRWLRNRCAKAALARLQAIQPEHGGFLEAAPLVAFVLMSLLAANEGRSPVARRCVSFLLAAQRADGSWPIDTHLATWLTSLSVDALASGDASLPEAARERIERYLLAAQFRERHPYTGAAPGGWAWTHLPGGVPDADDTAGALIALHYLQRGTATERQVLAAAEAGLRWLLDLQNRDGGMPTFCRGWGALPFDRSCPDITAHTLRAFHLWRGNFPRLRQRLAAATKRGLHYLRRTQREDGTWLPLWFGNQYATGKLNPVYGTSQVVVALACMANADADTPLAPLVERGLAFLRGAQNSDGGWGGERGVASSVEETALALRALLQASPEAAARTQRASRWLEERTDGWRRFPAAPIGLYFSSLWYAEALYPLVHATAAGVTTR